MRVLAFAAALVASAGPAAAAPVPKHLMKEPEGDQGKLQGKWKLQSLRMGGMDVGGDLAKSIDLVMEFRGDKLVVTANVPGQGGAMKSTGTVKFDPKAKTITATQMEAVGPDGKPVNKSGPATQAMGYVLDGDKLTFASSTGGDRAADPAKPGPNTIVMTFTRLKE